MWNTNLIDEKRGMKKTTIVLSDRMVSLSNMLILAIEYTTGKKVLATKNRIKSMNVLHGTKPASVSLFFMNGDSSNIKIIANVEGIQALREELEEAEKALRRNKSYLFGDPLWWRGNSRVVAIEPVLSVSDGKVKETVETVTSVNPELGPRLLMGGLILSLLVLTIIGAITVFQWLF